MNELITLGIGAHLIGDYLFQNDYLAREKTKKHIPALIHVLLYSIPFYFLLGISWSLFFITATHFFIDRYRLAIYWIKLINWNWKSDNFGFSNDKPVWFSLWLLIIYDNSLHIIINTTAIYFYIN